MRNAHPQFGDTLHDWQSDPSNRRVGTLFQPKSLGTLLPDTPYRRRARGALTWLLTSVAIGGTVIAMAAFGHALHWL